MHFPVLAVELASLQFKSFTYIRITHRMQWLVIPSEVESTAVDDLTYEPKLIIIFYFRILYIILF
jgi:hypothetical protein